ncbi:Sodium/calcium exchanger protein [Ceratobasidium sp. AG-Ba]|nr:Sodium/calcium exchanger protein [Ceratobasidium sp. AG-Ba]
MNEKAPSTNTATATAVSPSSSREGMVRNPSRGNTTRNGDLEAGVNGAEHDGDVPHEHHHRHHMPHLIEDSAIPRAKDFVARFKGEGRRVPGWTESCKNALTHSWLNAFVIFIPFSWAAHWAHWHYSIVFAFSFLAIIPLEKLSDYGGEQMALYLGASLGDFLVITLDNVVEATLAIILLTHCELKLLQSTIVGVILLHLLLVPGMAFLTGGARIWEQHLKPHPTQLNHSLLTFGVLSLLLPLAFFTALPESLPNQTTGAPSSVVVLKRLVARAAEEGGHGKDVAIQEALMRSVETLAVRDATRGTFLKFSRGLAILLLIAYIGSRIYLHNPPGDENSLKPAPNAPAAEKHIEAKLEREEPQISPWFGIVLLTVTVALIAVTAEWLVSSFEPVREQHKISAEWFGIILLPLLSYAADGCIAILYFVRAALFFHPDSPDELAKARSIDLSIQFVLFWMPLVVLIGWWTHREMSLLFDLWEVAVLIGACFLVNYVTADAKTNWVEGMVMVLFYVMISLVAWFYDGQPEVHEMLRCGPVSETLALVAATLNGTSSEGGGEAAGHAARLF